MVRRALVTALGAAVLLGCGGGEPSAKPAAEKPAEKPVAEKPAASKTSVVRVEGMS